jgi:hypothetical protein
MDRASKEAESFKGKGEVEEESIKGGGGGGGGGGEKVEGSKEKFPPSHGSNGDFGVFRERQRERERKLNVVILVKKEMHLMGLNHNSPSPCFYSGRRCHLS